MVFLRRSRGCSRGEEDLIGYLSYFFLDVGAWEGVGLADDDDASFARYVAFHEVLQGWARSVAFPRLWFVGSGND